MFSKTILFGLGRPPKDIWCIFLVPRPHSPWQQWSHVTLWVTVSHGLPCYPITRRWTHGEPPIGRQETSWREENDGPSALTSFLPDAERFQTNISFSVKRSSLWEHNMLHVKSHIERCWSLSSCELRVCFLILLRWFGVGSIVSSISSA